MTVRDEGAARSAADCLRTRAAGLPHTEAVADCLHCNARFLAEWVLEVLGPAKPRPAPPGPPDPPRTPRQSQWTEHPTR